MNYKVQFLLIIGVIALCLSYMSFPADACSVAGIMVKVFIITISVQVYLKTFRILLIKVYAFIMVLPGTMLTNPALNYMDI